MHSPINFLTHHINPTWMVASQPKHQHGYFRRSMMPFSSSATAIPKFPFLPHQQSRKLLPIPQVILHWQLLPTFLAGYAFFHDDEELSLVQAKVLDPSKMTKSNMEAVNYNYHQALRRGYLFDERGMLFYAEPLHGTRNFYYIIYKISYRSCSLTKYNLRAFHSNPIGRHYCDTAVWTLHRIRLRFYWPHMYQYID